MALRKKKAKKKAKPGPKVSLGEGARVTSINLLPEHYRILDSLGLEWGLRSRSKVIRKLLEMSDPGKWED